jgi:hypothetical protein
MDTIGISQTDFLSGGISMTFDLEKARDAAKFDDRMAITMFPLAIAEIERLRASLIDLHAEYINTLEKNPGCSAWDLDEQSDADQRRLRKNAAHAISIVEPLIYLQADQQAAQIKSLEDALAEERARGNHYGMSYEDAVGDGEFERWIIDGEKDLPKFYLDRVRAEARRQLKEEGKIGPDAKPRSWQITDERIGLLEYCLETLLDAPDIEEIPGPGHSIEMLRAMLREAE